MGQRQKDLVGQGRQQRPAGEEISNRSEAGLRSPTAAFTRTQAEAIATESKDAGKQALVFAAAKFINHRSLRELRVDFAQLPYALQQRAGRMKTMQTQGGATCRQAPKVRRERPPRRTGSGGGMAHRFHPFHRVLQ